MRRVQKACLLALIAASLILGLPGSQLDSVSMARPSFAAVASARSARQSFVYRNYMAARERHRKALAILGDEPPLPERATRMHNVSLKAALAADSAPLSDGISWRVLKRDPGDDEDAELVWSGGTSEPEITLKPGLYHAEASYGLAKNGEDFEIMPDRSTELVVPLNAGTLKVHGAAIRGAPPLDDIYFILRSAEAKGGEPKVTGYSSLSSPVFHVPAGDYKLEARHGLANIEMPVTVTAGIETETEAVLNTGVLTLSAKAKENGHQLSGATFFVYEAEEEGVMHEIARSKLDEPKFSLPAGGYRIAAALGLARTETSVVIKPGESKGQNIVLNAGGIHLSSKLAGSGAPIDQPLLYRVYSLSTEGKANQELVSSSAASPTLFLPTGRYRVESQYGWHNARQAQEVEVTAGEVKTIAFEHKASDVKLRLVPSPGGEAMDRVKWTLKYNGGGTVLISQDAVPALILQAGSYQAMAQHDTKTYTQTFEAASNQQQIIEIIAQ
jgi:hypothetical protein